MIKLANFIKRVKFEFKTRKNDLAIALLIIFVILLVMGSWRLKKIKPQKEPIRIERG